MYFTFKPKGKVLVNQSLNKIIENSNEFKISSDSNSGYNIQYYHLDSKNWIYIGNIDYFYNFTKREIYLNLLDLVLYTLPEYVSGEQIYESLIQLFSNAFGELEITNLYQGTQTEINSENIEKIAFSMLISTQEGREILQEKIDIWSGNNKKLTEICTELNDFNHQFKTMLFIEYLYVKSNINPESQDKEYIAEITEHIYKLLEEYKGEEFDLYLFKLMIGRKAVFSYLFNLLPKSFYLNKYGAQLSKLRNISSEISQLLLIEYVSACTGNMLKGSSPHVENVLSMMEEVDSIYLPEAKSLYTDFTTGIAKDSLQEYKDLSKEYKQVRTQYKQIEGDRSLLKSFEGFIKQHYYPRLSWSDKLLNSHIELTTSTKLAIISLAFAILFGISQIILLFIKRNSFINNPDVTYIVDEVNGDMVFGMIFVSILLIFPVLFVFGYSVIALKRKVQLKTDKTLWMIISIGFAVIIAPIMMIYFIIMVITFQALATEGSFYAFDESGIAYGYESIEYNEMNTIKLSFSDCSESSSSDCSTRLVIEFETDDNSTDLRIKDPIHYCEVSQLIITGAKENEVEIVVDPLFAEYLLKINCTFEANE
jgi:hypothetical protein